RPSSSSSRSSSTSSSPSAGMISGRAPATRSSGVRYFSPTRWEAWGAIRRRSAGIPMTGRADMAARGWLESSLRPRRSGPSGVSHYTTRNPQPALESPQPPRNLLKLFWNPDMSQELPDFLAARPQLRFIDLLLNDLNGVDRGKRVDVAGSLKVFQN